MDENENKTIETEVSESKKPIRSFADVQATLAPTLGAEDAVEPTVVYFYMHRTVRDYRFGDFHFRDFLLTLRSEEENQDFIDAYLEMSEDERTQIIEYHPDVAAKVYTPVGQSGAATAVARGPAATSQFKDPKLLTPAKTLGLN